MKSYLQIFHGDDSITDTTKSAAMFHFQMNSLERGCELQKNVIAIVADELAVPFISEEYEPPY